MLTALLALVACTPDAAPPTEAEPASEDHGRIEEHGALDVMYLWGTRREMGYAEGALSCGAIAELFRGYLLEHLVGTYTDYDYDTAKLLVLGSTTFDPADLEELEGYYEGATATCTDEQLTVESPMFVEPYRLQLEDLLFANAIADFGCSSFTVWGDASASGDTLHGRNFDWAVDPEGTFAADHVLKVYGSVDEGARFASVMVPAMQGCVSCVTDEGVSLTMHNTTGLPADAISGISPRMLSARAALAATTGASDVVAAAEEVLEARRQLIGNNLHLAMPVARGGGIGGVVLEVDGQGSHADGQVTVRRPGQDTQEPRADVTLAANHYALRRIDLGDADSNGRVETLAARIDEGPVAREAAVSLLDDVRNGYGATTVHSVVVDAARRELEVYVAPAADVPATAAEPTVFDLDELFARLDELSGS